MVMASMANCECHNQMVPEMEGSTCQIPSDSQVVSWNYDDNRGRRTINAPWRMSFVGWWRVLRLLGLGQVVAINGWQGTIYRISWISRGFFL